MVNCYTELSFYRVERSQREAERWKYWMRKTLQQFRFFFLFFFKCALGFALRELVTINMCSEDSSTGVGGGAPRPGGVPGVFICSTCFHETAIARCFLIRFQK